MAGGYLCNKASTGASSTSHQCPRNCFGDSVTCMTVMILTFRVSCVLAFVRTDPVSCNRQDLAWTNLRSTASNPGTPMPHTTDTVARMRFPIWRCLKTVNRAPRYKSEKGSQPIDHDMTGMTGMAHRWLAIHSALLSPFRPFVRRLHGCARTCRSRPSCLQALVVRH